MLKWCAYCQQFQGEIKPYDDFTPTHGMCSGCAAKGLDHSDMEIGHARKLKDLQAELVRIGKSRDLNAASHAISEATKAGVLPVDLLMGLISPLLYQIGEDWKNGSISVAQEHRFTSFCENILQKVESLSGPEVQPHDGNHAPQILIVNAHGNSHTLAIRILALWLMGKGVHAQSLWPSPSLKDMEERVRNSKARVLLISVALAEHRTAAVEIAKYFAALPSPERPRIIVGGYAVKCGLVSPIPEAELLFDISALKI